VPGLQALRSLASRVGDLAIEPRQMFGDKRARWRRSSGSRSDMLPDSCREERTKRKSAGGNPAGQKNGEEASDLDDGDAGGAPWSTSTVPSFRAKSVQSRPVPMFLPRGLVPRWRMMMLPAISFCPPNFDPEPLGVTIAALLDVLDLLCA